MEEEVPSTPTQRYDWSTHINTIEENDYENDKASEGSTSPTAADIDRDALSKIEEMYGSVPAHSDTFQPEVLQKFRDFIGTEMPPEIIDKLQSSGNTKPWQIINFFRGNQQTLIRFITTSE